MCREETSEEMSHYQVKPQGQANAGNGTESSPHRY